MFLAAGGSSAVGGVPGLVRWLWGNQPLFSLSGSQAWPLTDCQQLWEEEQQMPATEKPPALQLNQSQLSRDGLCRFLDIQRTNVDMKGGRGGLFWR